MDKELSDADFVGCLERAGILKSVVMTKNLEGFCDVKGLRHLVRRWSPSFHTFFFSVGELIVTLEDVENTFLLPMFGNKSPFNIQLSVEDLVVEEKLFKHFSGRTTSLGGRLARMVRWFKVLSKEEKSMRQVGFIVLWLSKFLFGEFPRYGIKFAFFPLAIWIAQGISYPLAFMYLGHLYSQLDLVHADELEDSTASICV